MRQKSHMSLAQKGWGLSLNILLILMLFPVCVQAYTPADYTTSTTNLNNPIFNVRVNNVWQPISIKYGLIMEGGQLKYSSELKGNKFYWTNSFTERQSTATTSPLLTSTIKFNVSTIIPDNAIGFFYEFSTGSEGKYYAKKDMIVYPDKWHIYYDDLIKHYGKDNVVVENNRILIYNVQGNKLLNFDPEGGGDGIPTDCILTPYQMYNVTTLYEKEVINMSGKVDFSGICTDISMGWYDNSSGTWAIIPSIASDLSCTGATCTQSPVVKNVWYNRTITCEAANTYYTYIYVRYKDGLGALWTDNTAYQPIYCIAAPTNVTLYYPENGTEVCTTTPLSFQVNVTSPANQRIWNISLFNDIGGTWHRNGTWYQHFLNSSNTLTLIYFNNSNKTENKNNPACDIGFCNDSLNMEAGLLGDTGLNFSNKTGRISYDDTINELNLTYGTICLWLMPNEDYGAGGSKYTFIDYPNTNENIYLAYSGAALDWQFKKEHLNNNYVLSTTMNNKPKRNEWLFLCIAWDNSYSGIYVNGSVKASSTGNAAPNQRWGHFEIGGTGTPNENCACIIDEFVIFDRRLSDTQITNLYLTSNRTMNFTNIGSVPAGSYLWNAQAWYYPSNNYNYSNHNHSLSVRNCGQNPVPLLLHDSNIGQELTPYIIGFSAVIFVWLIILFLLFWYRKKAKNRRT